MSPKTQALFWVVGPPALGIYLVTLSWATHALCKALSDDEWVEAAVMAGALWLLVGMGVLAAGAYWGWFG